ncbi:hypothetical protein [Halobellus sp. GM3]|uniref:hypothetical protein n=1 Tax=Halobellus sp. GM3 TaxID=3458410 RepID=UPI00403E1562
MVLRAAALAFGLVELIAPRPFVNFWMDLAAADDDVELRSWVYTAARLEGVVLVLWALKSRRTDPSES